VFTPQNDGKKNNGVCHRRRPFLLLSLWDQNDVKNNGVCHRQRPLLALSFWGGQKIKTSFTGF